MKISHMEDKNVIAYCTENREYTYIEKYIEDNKNNLTYFVEKDDVILGYSIKKVQQLSKIYEKDVYSISFYFKNTYHNFNEEQNELMGKLIKKLSLEISKIKGYLVVKVPSGNTMLINQINEKFPKYIFAGGTVCYYTNKLNPKEFKQDGLQIELLKTKDKAVIKDKLIHLGKKSFEDYFGQYHISHIMRDRAPDIYSNWVEEYVNNDSNEDFLLAKYKGHIAGFLTMDTTPHALEMVLSAVNDDYRGLKIYERMIRAGVDLSINSNRLATLSTQFDNYLVQRAWVNIGFKPYYSFYLFHINNI